MYKAELFTQAFRAVWPNIGINNIDETIVNYIAGRAKDLFYMQLLLNNQNLENYYDYCTHDICKRLEKQAKQAVRKYFEDYVNDAENWPLYRIFVSFYIDNWESSTYFEDYFRTVAHMIAQDLFADMYNEYFDKGAKDGE